MVYLVVVGEGQTEEAFVNTILSPHLGVMKVFASPRLVTTSGRGRGGALTRDRVVRFLSRTLKERTDTFVTTFFDLYALPGDFPGRTAAATIPNPLERASRVERELETAVVAAAGCRPERFFAHIQPYEFEALLFSDTDTLVQANAGWRAAAGTLRQARTAAATPEHINDGPDTHPSKRLEGLRPGYEKVLNGPAIAGAIGLDRIRLECRHFDAWLGRVEALQPL